MRNQTSFRLTTTLLPTDSTAKTTQVINKVDSSGNKFYPTFTEETVVITNDDRTVMETTKATCSNWVLTFVKRGLSDDASATEVANRKLTWNPWSLCFITAWASDWVDAGDDITWTWDQTYAWDATYKWELVTEKWVKYPNFADETALNAYASPFGWMFATVDDTGELYRYNAQTEQWDLVSTVELGTFIIRESDTAPEEWTADNIVTLRPNSWNIYVWDKVLVWRTRSFEAEFDLIAVWGGWAWGTGWKCWSGNYFAWSWGWGWEVIAGKYVWTEKSYEVVIWCGGGSVSWIKDACVFPWYRNWGDWWDTKFWPITAHWWQAASIDTSSYKRSIWGISWRGYLWCYNACAACSWGWWGWSGGIGCACTAGSMNWGDGWPWKCWYGWGWGWWAICFGCCGIWGCWIDWGGDWWRCEGAWCNATCYWWGWGGWTQCSNWGIGCQWVVIVKYPSDWSGWISCATWGTVTTETIDDVEYCVHTFTANWTFCIVS